MGKRLIPPMSNVKMLWTRENNIKRMGSHIDTYENDNHIQGVGFRDNS